MGNSFKETISREFYRIAQSTWNPNVRGSRLDYTSQRYINLPQGENVVGGMVSEGVGTKIICAEMTRCWEHIGLDLLAMVLDDITRLGNTRVMGLTMTMDIGDHPGDAIMFDRLSKIFREIAVVCAHECIPILDGEFAELGDRIEGGVLPLILNGSALWTAEEKNLIDGTKVKAGDAIVALPEPGFRSNGFTYLRELLSARWGGRDWVDKAIPTSKGDQQVSELVMIPSTLYYPTVRSVLASDAPVSGLVHITGGGVPGKLKKYLQRSNTSAVIDNTMKCLNPLISYLIERGQVSVREAVSQWNMGYGFLIITPEPVKVRDIARDHFPEDVLSRIKPQIVGEIVEAKDGTPTVSMSIRSTVDF